MRLISFLFFLFLNILFRYGYASENLRVAHQKEFEPYSWVDSAGNPQGIFIDWWKIWSEKANVELEFIPGNTEECIELVLRGDADVVAGLFFEQSHIRDLVYSGFIMRLNTVVVLRKGLKPKSIHQVKEPLGILGNEISYQYVIEKYPDINLEKFDDFEELREKVESREIAGFIYEFPNPVVKNISISMPEGYYQYLIIREDKIRPAVKKGNSKMLELLSLGSAQVTDQDMATIARKYDFLQEESDFNWWMIIGGVSTLLFLGTVVLLRRQKVKGPNKISLEPAEITKMIEKGESNVLEFKSSLRWDYRLEQSNKALELVIIKTISAFLNSHGGLLLIGINDDGEILGLDNDYKSIGKSGKDSFILFVTNLINKHLGKKAHRFVRIEVVEISGKDVSVVLVEPSDSPVFIGKNESEEFFIRASASSQPLAMSETLEYIKSRWG